MHYYAPSPAATSILKLNEMKVGNLFSFATAANQTSPSDGAAYLTVAPGSGSGKFVVPKVGTTTDSVVIKSFSYDFAPNSYQSLFVVDTLSAIRAVIAKDTLDLPAPGKVKVRFVNTMYNVPGVDIALLNGDRLVQSLAFGSVSNYVELDANQTFNIRFYNPNTTTQLTGTSATTFLVNLTTGDRRIYTVVLRGIAGNSTTALAPSVFPITNR